MMVFYSGYGRWGDYTGLYGELIKISGVFELQYDERVSIERTGQVFTDTLSPCIADKDGRVPWPGEEPEESDRDFFKIFRIDGKGHESLEQVLFTRQDIINDVTVNNGHGFTVHDPEIIPALYKALTEHNLIKPEGLEKFKEAFENGNGFITWSSGLNSLIYFTNKMIKDVSLIECRDYIKTTQAIFKGEDGGAFKYTSLNTANGKKRV